MVGILTSQLTTTTESRLGLEPVIADFKTNKYTLSHREGRGHFAEPHFLATDVFQRRRNEISLLF